MNPKKFESKKEDIEFKKLFDEILSLKGRRFNNVYSETFFIGDEEIDGMLETIKSSCRSYVSQIENDVEKLYEDMTEQQKHNNFYYVIQINFNQLLALFKGLAEKDKKSLTQLSLLSKIKENNKISGTSSFSQPFLASFAVKFVKEDKKRGGVWF